MTTRAIYRAISVPGCPAPYDRASLKIFYPAAAKDTEEERNTGVIPADPSAAPFPVVIMMPGINVGPESYFWLAGLLAELGVVTVTYTLVAEEMPGYISLTPGLALGALMPGEYGKQPSATVVGPILQDLDKLNNSGVLAGCLDLERVVLGGHSAGGTVALLNARADWFPGVCAAFSYGAHAGAATALGYEQDSLFPVPSELPLLVLGGTRDGCIANSGARYGEAEGSATRKVEQTFDQAISSERGDCYLGLVEGANHFSLAYPRDESTGRPFIDLATTRPDPDLRQLLGVLIGQFVSAVTGRDDSARTRLESLLERDELIHRSARR